MKLAISTLLLISLSACNGFQYSDNEKKNNSNQKTAENSKGSNSGTSGSSPDITNKPGSTPKKIESVETKPVETKPVETKPAASNSEANIPSVNTEQEININIKDKMKSFANNKDISADELKNTLKYFSDGGIILHFFNYLRDNSKTLNADRPGRDWRPKGTLSSLKCKEILDIIAKDPQLQKNLTKKEDQEALKNALDAINVNINLHTKYSSLLKKALEKVNSDFFKKKRLRCDYQVMPWIDNALDALHNKVIYTAKGADGGMSNIKEVPKTPKEMIIMMTNDEQTCGIPHYINRVESLNLEDEELKEFISEMKSMLTELRLYYN